MVQEHLKGLEEPSNKKAKVNRPVTGKWGVEAQCSLHGTWRGLLGAFRIPR